MAKLADMPNEIHLQFFAHMPLNALIAARGVNQHWRRLVPHAHVLPARRPLLDLYLDVLKPQCCLRTRPSTSRVHRRRPCDRKGKGGYLDTSRLRGLHQCLPEGFCTAALLLFYFLLFVF
ncbi:hypothetical protein JB92DRAFT_2909898 [Gautieria morchelliformis]|nr:hypothetical protein JB92DRAFT_2909898 [Gautieria morchelliformis]